MEFQDISAGDRIVHSVFGPGRVIRTCVLDADKTVVVWFDEIVSEESDCPSPHWAAVLFDATKIRFAL